jgi:Asp-tRNA(Asn)/Glu-tRNA(Gln) amidotransferase A subunit family amidase
MEKEWTRMSAGKLSDLIRSGQVSSEEVTQACLDRIDAAEETVQAWAYLNRDYAIEQARRADRAMSQEKVLGSLHGVPVGVKDIIDTEDMPTEYGTVLYSGWRPSRDSAVVSHLRSAGAVILGKTVPPTRLLCSRKDPQSPQPQTHARGLFQRIGGRGGRRDGTAGCRHPDQRLGDPAGGLLRRGRF